MKKKNSFLLGCLLSLSLMVTGCGNQAASGNENTAGAKTAEATKIDYPKEPIKIIVPFAAGGGTDTTARVLAGAVAKHLPENAKVVVENKTGGAGTIGTTNIVKAKPDGYTLGLITTSPVAIQTHYGKTAYQPSDLEPIIQFTSVPGLLVVQADSPWKTFDEWVEYVKQNPDTFTYATSGAGGVTHIGMEAVNLSLDTKTKHVPFEGNGPAMTALLGGHVMGANFQPYDAKPHIDSGKLRALAILGSYKPKGFEDLPLLKDQGIKSSIDTFNGIAVAKGTPEEIKVILHDAFKKAMEEQEVIDQFTKIGTELTYAGPEEFQKKIDETYQLAGEVLKSSGLIKE